jgi:single-stranded-DNA-specific exonuclease
VHDTGWSKVVKDAHIRFSLQQNGVRMTGIGFHMAEKINLLKEGKPVDIVYKIDINEWNGETTLQLKVIDVQLS